MLSLLLAPAVLGEFIEPFVSLTSSADPMMDLKAQLQKMKDSMESPTPIANPCAEDMKRFGCEDAACLKQKATSLAGSCLMMLSKEIVPSPSPMPRVISRSAMPVGVFSMTTTDNDGHVERMSGSLSSLLGGAMAPRSAVLSSARPMMMAPSLGGMLSLFPPEIMQQMLSPGLAAILREVEREEEDEDEDEEASHPCAREVDICTRETHSTTRSAIEGCLVKHFESLSAECRCFVHHITDGKVPASPKPAQVAPPKKKLASPEANNVVTVHAVPLRETTIYVEDLVEDAPRESFRHAQGHSLACLLFFTIFFFLTFFAVRACCILLCCRARASRRVVIVPPEAAVIKTVDPPPMLISEIKAVQVAKPLKA